MTAEEYLKIEAIEKGKYTYPVIPLSKLEEYKRLIEQEQLERLASEYGQFTSELEKAKITIDQCSDDDILISFPVAEQLMFELQAKHKFKLKEFSKDFIEILECILSMIDKGELEQIKNVTNKFINELKALYYD